MTEHRGHCRCGSVAIRTSAEPEVSVFCHCDDCRRSAGAPLIASVGIPRASVAWDRDASLARYVSGTCTRTFCGTCGSPVAQEHESAPELIFFNTCFMENPENFPPTYHSFGGDQLDWLKLKDDLPRYEATKVIKVAS